MALPVLGLKLGWMVLVVGLVLAGFVAGSAGFVVSTAGFVVGLVCGSFKEGIVVARALGSEGW